MTEAGIDHGDEFGEERLIARCAKIRAAAAAALVQNIVDAVCGIQRRFPRATM